MSSTDLVEMSVSVVNAHLSMNRMSSRDVPQFIREVHETLQSLLTDAALVANEPDTGARKPVAPAPVARSIHLAETSSEEAPAAAEENAIHVQPLPLNNKIAHVRQDDISDPVFKGLDPWLAKRISPNTARKLDPSNPVHPTIYNEKLICLEDGATIKLLRPYIKNRYDLSISDYLDKWNLPDDYPTAPPAYVERKRALAMKSGLGKVTRAKREKKGSRTRNAKAQLSSI